MQQGSSTRPAWRVLDAYGDPVPDLPPGVDWESEARLTVRGAREPPTVKDARAAVVAASRTHVGEGAAAEWYNAAADLAEARVCEGVDEGRIERLEAKVKEWKEEVEKAEAKAKEAKGGGIELKLQAVVDKAQKEADEIRNLRDAAEDPDTRTKRQKLLDYAEQEVKVAEAKYHLGIAEIQGCVTETHLQLLLKAEEVLAKLRLSAHGRPRDVECSMSTASSGAIASIEKMLGIVRVDAPPTPFPVADEDDNLDFTWEDNKKEAQHSQAYLLHLREKVPLPNGNVTYHVDLPTDFFDADLTSGSSFAKVTGNCDVAVSGPLLDHSRVFVAIELKKSVVDKDTRQHELQLLWSSFHSGFPVVAVLTDLRGDWRFSWLEARSDGERGVSIVSRCFGSANEGYGFLREVVSRFDNVGPVSSSSLGEINEVLAGAGSPPVGCFPSFVSEVDAPDASFATTLPRTPNRDDDGEGELELERMRDVLEPGEFRKFFLGKVLQSYIVESYSEEEIDAMRAPSDREGSRLTEDGAWRGMYM